MARYTSIEQSAHLIELGLNPATADMDYHCLKNADVAISSVPFIKDASEVENSAYNALYYRIPCWSLGALLEVMPKYIIDEYTSKGWLGMCLLYYSSWRWIVYYSNEDIDSPAIHEEQGNTLLEAAYNMVCWLLEEGYIKKEA